MAQTVTMHGRELELAGSRPGVGQAAPDFKAVDTELNEVVFSKLPPKIYVLSCVPSLDTAVCNKETRRFSQEAQRLGEGVEIITISMDLPFAQARWRDESGVRNIRLLSDHREASFATAYGTLIKPLRLLSRTVFVLDEARTIRLIEDCREITNEPDYDRVLDAIAQILGQSRSGSQRRAG